MNRISVATNSRNSAKVGDRNSSVGCHPVELGQMECRQRVGAAEHALHLLPERERPVEHVHLLLQQRPQLRKLAAPFHRGRGDHADHEGGPGAGGCHDQHGGDRARNAAALQETSGRRQHGADDEGHRDRQKERLGEIEAGDDADDQQTDEGDGHHFRAADERRHLGLAVGDRRAFVTVGGLALTGQRFCRRRFGSQRLRRSKAWRSKAWLAQAWWECRSQWFSPARGGDHRQTRPRDPDWHHNVAQTRGFQSRRCELYRA